MNRDKQWMETHESCVLFLALLGSVSLLEGEPDGLRKTLKSRVILSM